MRVWGDLFPTFGCGDVLGVGGEHLEAQVEVAADLALPALQTYC